MEQNGVNQELKQLDELENLRNAPLEVILAHPIAKVIYDIGFKMGQGLKELQDLDSTLQNDDHEVQKTPEMTGENGEEPLNVYRRETPDMVDMEEMPVKVEPVDAEEEDMDDISLVKDEEEVNPEDSPMESDDLEPSLDEPVMNGETPAEEKPIKVEPTETEEEEINEISVAKDEDEAKLDDSTMESDNPEASEHVTNGETPSEDN